MLKNLIIKSTACFGLFSLAMSQTNAQQARSFTNNPFILPQSPLTEQATRATTATAAAATHNINRSFDGTNNNIGSTQKMLYGSANIQLYREIAPAYAAADPKNAMNGTS